MIMALEERMTISQGSDFHINYLIVITGSIE